MLVVARVLFFVPVEYIELMSDRLFDDVAGNVPIELMCVVLVLLQQCVIGKFHIPMFLVFAKYILRKT